MPYAGYPQYTPAPQQNASPWPLVAVDAQQPTPPPTVAPPATTATTPVVAPSSAQPSVTAGPVPTGGVASADPEIDGPPELADVEVGPISMSGGTVPDVSTALARMHGTFRRCYRAALVFDIKTTGDVHLVAQIGDKGRVIDAVADSVTGIPNSVVTCLIERVSLGPFSKPTAIPTTVRISLHLLPTTPHEKPARASSSPKGT